MNDKLIYLCVTTSLISALTFLIYGIAMLIIYMFQLETMIGDIFSGGSITVDYQLSTFVLSTTACIGAYLGSVEYFE